MAYSIRVGQETSIRGWKVRIDQPRNVGPGMQRHVHVYRSGQKGEYSWNVDGTRHDMHRFPNNETGIEAAKRIASDVLGINRQMLHCIIGMAGGSKATFQPLDANGFVMHSGFSVGARRNQEILVLGSGSELIVLIVDL